ncbi:MAG: 2,3-bisphosphoglycerate-independent phosphoglycerate mutase [Armatimonadetes bacterium]|nr:2,3-bisphosphoglycerate-independent phosphoglycerate mutase [Armatimonadota bacterium]
MARKPLLLCILDGWGHNPNWYGNAVKCARTPNFDRLAATYPLTYLRCQGEAVGLRDGLMGNSEVGHENLGAGRTVLQEILFIDRAIDDGSFFDKPAFVACVERVKQRGGRLHLTGLTSDGGVHSAESHYLALIDLAAQAGLQRDQVLFHVITDGRDTDPKSGRDYVARLEQHLRERGVGRIATVVGRYYAMDRDHRWPRTQIAYDSLVYGENRQTDGDLTGIEFERHHSALEAIEGAYALNDLKETDEFMKPKVLVDEQGQMLPRIADGDSLIVFNFRGDRPRQILRAFHDEQFHGFDRGRQLDVQLASMVLYDVSLPVAYGFKRQPPEQILGEVVAAAGLTQLRAAETEKYPHVSFFFNNQLEAPFPGETRLMVKSPPVATYDLQPEMSAYRLAGAVIDELPKNEVVILNFANPDMVGHTGIFEAAVKACETVDQCLGIVLERLASLGGRAIITADHGNAEEMINYAKITRADGTIDYSLREPHTTHTPANLTPCLLLDDERRELTLREGGALSDIAPTMLKLLGIKQPDAMTGESLF